MKRRRVEIGCIFLLALLASFTVGFFVGSEQNTQVQAAVTVEALPLLPESAQQPVQETTQETAQVEPTAETVPVQERLDLNSATLEELETLPGIGETLAQRILDYREAFGPFLTTDQIMEVSGIGEKRYEAIEALISVEE